MELTGNYVFPLARSVAYLDTAAEGLPFPGCQPAVEAYFRDKSLGTPGRDRLHKAEHEARCLAARMLGAAAEDVAMVSSASEGLNLLAGSIPWRAGDEVVLSDLEFPSNVLPWLRLRDRGVRMVTVSQVSYKSGARIAFLPSLAEAAHRAGAWLAVDATQAFGRVPVEVAGVDYLVASSYKWLLAPHGLGLVYLSPELRGRLNPSALGWYSVKDIFTPERFERFECKPGADVLVCGMPNFPGLYALGASLRYLLDIGPARIDAALAPLVRRLREGLGGLGLKLLTPPEPESASGIVSFEHPAAAGIGAALGLQGVVVWSGDGRVRASVHLYNQEADIDRCLAALGATLESLHA